jgi:hypothetical protein
LYFSRLDNQEALDKIKRKLSAGHKKLHWIKTADSKGNVFLLNVKEIEWEAPDHQTNKPLIYPVHF